MATAKQLKANRENAQKSSGPTSEAGKQTSSMNNFRHGLTSHALFFLAWEQPAQFDRMKEALKQEHQPATTTEHILVEKMVQHYWLSQRAQSLQTLEMDTNVFDADVQKAVANFARYQALHERLFEKALAALLKLRAEKRKAEIGFELQKHREADETRKAETHKLKTAILENNLNQNRARQQAEISTASQNRDCQKAEQRPNPDHQRDEIEPKTHPIAA